MSCQSTRVTENSLHIIIINSFHRLFSAATPMTERNFPASFWDQNHNMTSNASSMISNSSSSSVAAAARSAYDLYGAAAADPLQAATGRRMIG
jgi:hypothetical protein